MRSPRASSRAPIEAEARPLPSDESTPPVTKMYLVARSAVIAPPLPSLAHARGAGAGEAVLDPDAVDRDEGLRQRVDREESDARHLPGRPDRARLARERFETQVDRVHAAAVGILDHLARRVRVHADE